MFFLCLLMTLCWLGLMLFWHRFWRVDQRLPLSAAPVGPFGRVAIIVPARNEAENIQTSVASLLEQNYPGHFDLTVANDASTDDTGKILATIRAENFVAIETDQRPAGWAGKMWAVNQAISHAEKSKPDFYWLTDADIVHKPQVLSTVMAKVQAEQLALYSQMVKLPCQTIWEKLLVPAYIFYFSLIYPFRAIADPSSPIAGAAGGSILIRRDALEDIGGIQALHDAVIDDCTLARLVKKSGRKIALSFSETSVSLRGYENLSSFWQMVQRSAYTQLGFSPLLLTGVVLGLFFSHLLPVLLVCLPALAIMAFIYWPSVRYYGLSPLWAFTLPLAGALFGAMTISSALAHHFGLSNKWRGRQVNDD